tara:strand:- start:187 stop:573 length:387 start_codon:yes stop_codon:yes gene_type:complete
MDQHYEVFTDDEEENNELEKIDKIKKIKLEDFLAFPKTRKILEVQNLDNFFENCEKDIKKYYSKVKKHCKEQMSSALKFDISSKGIGEITGLVYKYIDKDYNLEIFYENPELASSLLAKLEENKNRKF